MESHRLPQSVFAWGPQAADGRSRTSSSPMAPPSFSPSGGLSLNVSASHLPHPRSYPSSPSTPSNHRNGGSGSQRSVVSSSYPVFPAHAQQSPSRANSGVGPRLREAVLHTKNPLAASAAMPTQNRPKMHLYASDKKKPMSAPKEEEFPEVPVEWLVGSPSLSPSDSSSVSISELHSGDISEDESELSFKSVTDRSSASPTSVPTTPGLGDSPSDSTCHYLSVGLKALLKVQA